MSCVELKIVVSNEEAKRVEKVLDYTGEIVLSQDNRSLNILVEKAKKAFGENVDNVVITAKLIWE